MESLCQLINTIFVRPVLPNSRYFVDKLFNDRNSVRYHATCPNCEAYVGTYDKSDKREKICTECAKQFSTNTYLYQDFFITLDVSNEIAWLLQNNEKYYLHVINERQHQCQTYEDIYDGKEYRKFVETLSDLDKRGYATVTFNTDGSPVFESSTCSIWPIQLQINELPIDVRTNHLIVYALWFGKKKPDINVFFKPFTKYMNKLGKSGIPCVLRGENKMIKIFPITCCVDAVARAPLQGLTQYNGYYGCNWCLHPGKWITSRRTASDNDTSTLRGKGIVKYPLTDIPPLKRNSQDSLRHIDEAISNGKPIYGFKTASQLLNVNNFDIINGFVPDHMHCAWLGICRQFAEYWFAEKNQDYSIGSRGVGTIENILTNLTVPKKIERLTRALRERKFWKAKEWENWCLYYSLPCLSCVLPKKYVDHWASFVEAMYILLQERISSTSLIRAERLIQDFVGLTEMYYKENAMTYNVHVLLHLTESVVNWGPLWAHSCFSFESGNGLLLKTITAAKGINYQICRFISMRQCESILMLRMSSKMLNAAINLCKSLDDRLVHKSAEMSNKRYFAHSRRHSQWINNLQ